MKRFIAGLLLGALLGAAVPVAAEFGWSDSGRLNDIRDTAKLVLLEIQGLRRDLAARK